MINEENFKTFLYFTECYIYQCISLDMLKEQILIFNSIEELEYRYNLKREVELLLNYQWDELEIFMIKNTKKRLKEYQMNYILNTILENLKVTLFTNFSNFINTFISNYNIKELKNQIELCNKITDLDYRKALKEDLDALKNYRWDVIKENINKKTCMRLNKKEELDYIVDMILENLEI